MELTQSDKKWINNYLNNVETNNSTAQDFEAGLGTDIEEGHAILNKIYEEGQNKTRKGVKQDMPQTIDDYGSYDVPSGGGNFFKPEAGDNRIRLCTQPMELRFHETKKDGKYSTVQCSGEGCELCKSGSKLKYKYAYLIINRKDGKVYVYEAPITVFRQIVAYATNEEYGDPKTYDLTIKKEGERVNTQYTVIASPKKSDLTEEEVLLVAESGITLEETYAEPKEQSEGQ